MSGCSSLVTRKRQLVMVLSACVAACGAMNARAAQVFYDVGAALNSGSGAQITPIAINNANQVAGYMYPPASVSLQGFKYTVGGTAAMFTSGFGGSSTTVTGMNSSGIVVGYGTDASHTNHGFTYDFSTNSVTQLPMAYAYGINASGAVVGANGTTTGSHALLYSGSAVTDLSSASGAGGTSSASGINSSGQISGYSSTASGAYHAMIYSGGTWTDLTPTLSVFAYSDTVAINNSGQVIGYTAPSFGTYTAFIATTSSFLNLSGLASTSTSVFPLGLDNAGDVVGYDQDSSYALHAVLWMANSATPINLNTYFASVDPADAANWNLKYANSINDNGMIAGEGTYTDPVTKTAYDRAFVLNVSSLLVPEPASLGLFGVGALLLAARRR